MKPLVNEFANPGSAYRGKPFWAWNGKLEPGELRRQLRVMKEMGLGGGFMHSRVGLGTAYLSEKWFECVQACIDECKKLDMEAWLYDEDRWPSGAAGGLVTQDPKYRMHRLVCNRYEAGEDFTWQDTTLAAFTANVSGTTASNVKRIKRGAAPTGLAEDACILEFCDQPMPCTSWYNGYTYLDTLDHEAVQEFIRVTHEAYKRECGDDFGKTVPGIFTDEPNYGHGARNQAPWTRFFRRTFRERYGYDIVAHLPEVFFNIEGREFPRARYHFYDCATFLFVDAFARQIGEWCDANGLQHTGHVLMEDTLSQQRNAVGSAMRFYEYMQAPGMDLLTEKWRIYDVAKGVSSVAHQFGRKWRLTETYGCTGWDFPFAGHKALGDWQVALGINLRCQHLSWYTMAGQAKRDYPAGIFDHSPWWPMYRKVEDYFARVLSVMTRGEEVRDLLVIHPIESGWVKLGDDAHAYDQALIDLRDTLLKATIDFDYGEEDILARHASVRKGAARGAALHKSPGPACRAEPCSALLRVGKAQYTTVLVPSLITIRSTTLKLLGRFLKAGGRVVFAGEVPRFVDGERTDRVVAFASACEKAPAKGRRLAERVEHCRRVSITDGAGDQIAPALSLLREDKDNAYLFVCNTGHSTAQLKKPQMDDVYVRDRQTAFDDVRIEGLAGFAGHPVELDPDTGAENAADAKVVNGVWRITTSLPALGSRLFVIPRRKQRRLPDPRLRLKPVSTKALAGAWDYELTEPNVFLLDWVELKVGKGRRQKSQHILLADYAIRDALGIPRRGGQMVQPWAREKEAHPTTTPVTLRYTFDVKTRPARELFLAMEQPCHWQIRLNGNPVSTDAHAGWWVDQSCRKLPLSAAMLVEGKNVLEMVCDYSAEGPDLEHVYLLGAFGVKVVDHHPVMTTLPATLRPGDWGGQGLAFYSGSVIYRRKVKVGKLRKRERLLLQVPDYKGSVVRVWGGGTEAGLLAWDPNELDVTDEVKDGVIDLGIEVIAHRRNSHGPLQLKDRWPAWHGPAEFVAKHEKTPRYYTVPCGLLKAPMLETVA
ncbi:MAG: glycosyl hydrolase [Kiritimatiellia bacterium]|jgi:hypothetical protein|nr:glycosyl hydrolase [Kiritimatiellia bacterium]MDP6631667.1 glycosyl hydrolase [Kiritimatiellia bacterium]MDP6810765.1 glycosyl hydrolase [Kiritimatiellia bacterium]MDP7022640.1 glycosyl hydrolase [Kiritimatiellia bacterium]